MYIRSGAWFAHSENVLLSLLASSILSYRKLVKDKILKIRGNNEFGDSRLIQRLTPIINLDAEYLPDLISWDKDVHEPIFTCSISSSDLKRFLEAPVPVPSLCILKVQRDP